MEKVIRFIKSETFIFVTLVFVLFGQIVHTTYLFESVRVVDLGFYLGEIRIDAINWFHAIVFAIAIEAAILMSILHGKSLASNIYAIASFATNLLYYAPWNAEIPQIVSTTLISAILSGSIWFFSDLFAEKVRENSEVNEELDLSLFSELTPAGAQKGSFKTTFPDNR